MPINWDEAHGSRCGVFSRGSQMGTLEVPCKFADLMEVPPLLEADFSS